MEKKLLDTFHSRCKSPPFWFFRQAGRYLPEYMEIRSRADNFLHFCYNNQLAVEATMQPIKRFDMDAAILFSDILVIPDALGVGVTFEKNEGPKLDKIFEKEHLKKIKIENLTTHLKPVYEIVSELRQKLPKEKTLIGFSGSPWTLACYMVEGGGSKNFERAVSASVKNNIFFEELIDILTEAVVLHLDNQIKYGADIVQLFDSWAGAAPLEQFEKYVVAPTKKIVSKLKNIRPDIPIISFPRCAGAKLADFADKTGVDGISIDQFTKLDFVKNEVIVIQGNLDPLLLAYGSVDQIISAAKNLIRQMEGRKYIFNLGHGIIPQTPVKNVHALCDFLKAYK